MFSLFFRTAIIYGVLMLSMRLSGKRQVGELQLSELVTAFLISEVASAPLSEPDIPLLYAILPITVLTCLEVAVSFITTKSVTVKKMFEPSPTVLIANGVLDPSALLKQRLTVDELMSSLRLKDISDVGEVRFCFLEHNGQISVFKNTDTVTLPVIVDGRIHGGHLRLLGRNEAWLNKRLKEQKAELSSVFVAISDGSNLNVYSKIAKNHKGRCRK